MHQFRVSAVVIAAGALVGSSVPSSAIIPLHLPGSGYYRHMGGGGMMMPKPPMPKPPMPKPPMGGGWGGGHMGGGDHGSGWHAGSWNHDHGGHGGSWHAGNWDHGSHSGAWHTGGGNWGHHGGWANGGQNGSWHAGGWGGGNWRGGSWHVGSWKSGWGKRPWGNWGYHPMPRPPIGGITYGMGGTPWKSGARQGYWNRDGFGGSLYAKFNADNTRLMAKYGGGDLEGKYGGSYGSYPPPPPPKSPPSGSPPPGMSGGYHPPGGTNKTYFAYRAGYSFKYAYRYRIAGKAGGWSSMQPTSGGSWGH